MTWVFSTNSNVIILISLQPDGVYIFDISNLDHAWYNRIHYSLKYLRSMILGCKDIVIRKSEFVAN